MDESQVKCADCSVKATILGPARTWAVLGGSMSDLGIRIGIRGAPEASTLNHTSSICGLDISAVAGEDPAVPPGLVIASVGASVSVRVALGVCDTLLLLPPLAAPPEDEVRRNGDLGEHHCRHSRGKLPWIVFYFPGERVENT